MPDRDDVHAKLTETEQPGSKALRPTAESIEQDEARRRDEARTKLAEAFESGLVEVGEWTWQREDLHARSEPPQSGD